MARAQHRAVVDAEITVVGGGRLQVRDLRVDVPGRDVSETEVAARLLASLGLATTARVRLQSVRKVRKVRTVPEAVGARGSVAPAVRRVDLSHVVADGMTTYPGLPGPQISAHLTRADSRRLYAPGTEFAIDRISMVGNTGTYLDSPFHRYRDGADLAALPLDHLADLPAVVVRAAPGADRAVDVAALAGLDVERCAVLLHTGGDRHWGTPAYGEPGPHLTEAGARLLVERGAVLVGIDALNIDDTGPAAAGARPAHSVLLAAGVLVVEHLTGLDRLPHNGARFTAAPPRVAGLGSFPVRAFATVPADGRPDGPSGP